MSTLIIYIQMAMKVRHVRTIIDISAEMCGVCLHLQVFGGKIQNSSIEDLAFMICTTTLTIYIQMAMKVRHIRTINKISADYIVVRECAVFVHLQVLAGKFKFKHNNVDTNTAEMPQNASK